MGPFAGVLIWDLRGLHCWHLIFVGMIVVYVCMHCPGAASTVKIMSEWHTYQALLLAFSFLACLIDELHHERTGNPSIPAS